ncbi:type IV conjugative transfer system protein TraL [Campylobacter sp. IFREMER_LSEM_CL1904]|uniref:type IV conjugative transfer system protein TraL n=1 Tax=Campylobacter TaxID=194 RepID=UPI00126EEFA4|nr:MULTISPECIES: type IV conjugative transfer system protein TraL [Campylobacter]MBT0825375.1 type IV conjugative transfer system protein TraL [Campylobacter lari]MBT0827045.1 type IV conjugative transfer system protein TraL [Campylobacter lari]MBT0831534.1 type IV conjugative transfer system protein TraL [Campylobacter lari]MCV3349720.1 type IV conjugative transfer system protein TraL [Campylobacter sp. RKI_CA19_01127]MCV3427944.1 type IV conjugative transfer system protein TraL [Campylobacte
MGKSESGYVQINKYIDTKPMFGDWEVDVLMVFSVWFALGIIFEKGFLVFSVFFLFGVLNAIAFEKIKKAKTKGYFFHILYMTGIKQPKSLMPSYMRYFVGA